MAGASRLIRSRRNSPPAALSSTAPGSTVGYDVELRWTPDATQAPGDDAPPTLATALREQLGLRLEATTQTMDFLVIDSAERPDEN